MMTGSLIHEWWENIRAADRTKIDESMIYLITPISSYDTGNYTTLWYIYQSQEKKQI